MLKNLFKKFMPKKAKNYDNLGNINHYYIKNISGKMLGLNIFELNAKLKDAIQQTDPVLKIDEIIDLHNYLPDVKMTDKWYSMVGYRISKWIENGLIAEVSEEEYYEYERKNDPLLADNITSKEFAEKTVKEILGKKVPKNKLRTTAERLKDPSNPYRQYEKKEGEEEVHAKLEDKIKRRAFEIYQETGNENAEENWNQAKIAIFQESMSKYL
jgi:hypothetical protein